MKAIGMDIGTTTISGVVFDMGSKTALAVRNIPNESGIRSGRSWERIQDAGWICQAAQAVLDGLIKEYPDVKAVGLTGQMHGIVYVNRDGEGVSPLYTWQDGRGDLPEFEGDPLTAWIEKRTGLALSSGYGLVTHLYNSKRNLAPKEGVSICTIADYLGMRLTGRKAPLMHVSNGASLGFFDSRQGCFRKEEMEKAGIGPEILPKITDKIAVLGQYRQIPVKVAVGDNQAGFLGAVGMEEGTLLLNMGTGGQISVLSGKYVEIPGIETRPFTDGKYLLVGASLCGGKAYALLERFFRSYAAVAGAKDEPQYPVMERLAWDGLREEESRMEKNHPNEGCCLGFEAKENRKNGKKPGAGEEAGKECRDLGVKVVTAFNGTRQDPGARGSVTGIGMDNFTPQGLVYGTLKGMAEELFLLYQLMEKEGGIKAEKIVASGNGFRKNVVLQKIAKRMFGIGLTMASCEEEAACGSAVCGLTGENPAAAGRD